MQGPPHIPSASPESRHLWRHSLGIIRIVLSFRAPTTCIMIAFVALPTLHPTRPPTQPLLLPLFHIFHRWGSVRRLPFPWGEWRSAWQRHVADPIFTMTMPPSTRRDGWNRWPTRSDGTAVRKGEGKRTVPADVAISRPHALGTLMGTKADNGWTQTHILNLCTDLNVFRLFLTAFVSPYLNV